MPSGPSQVQQDVFADNGNPGDDLAFLPEDYKAEARNRSWGRKAVEEAAFPAEYAEAFGPPVAQFEYQGAPYNVWLDNAHTVNKLAFTPGSSGTPSPLGFPDVSPSSDTGFGDAPYPPNEIDRLLAGEYGVLPDESSTTSNVAVNLDMQDLPFNGFDLGESNGLGTGPEEPAGPFYFGSAETFGFDANDAGLVHMGINSTLQMDIDDGEVTGPLLEFDPYLNVAQNGAEGNWNLDRYVAMGPPLWPHLLTHNRHLRSFDKIPSQIISGLFNTDQVNAFSGMPCGPMQPEYNREIRLEAGDGADDTEDHEGVHLTLPSYPEVTVHEAGQSLRRSTRSSGKGKGKEVAQDEPIGEEEEEDVRSSEYVFSSLNIEISLTLTFVALTIFRRFLLSNGRSAALDASAGLQPPARRRHSARSRAAPSGSLAPTRPTTSRTNTRS